MTTRILSHNVYWFQGHPFATDTPPGPNPAVLAALASLYASLTPALICLQEIQSQETATLLSAHLKTPAFYTSGRQLLPYGGASLSTHATLIADSASATDAPQRVWQLIQIPFGASRLAIANCHLPSARQLTSQQAAARRVQELQSILASHPATDILLGDFNETAPGPVSEFLAAQGYLDTATLLQNPDLPTNVTGVRNRRGDQIWLKKNLAPKLRAYCVTTEPDMRTTLPGITHLSDHFPLWIDLEANP